MIDAVKAKYSLPLLNSPKINGMWNSMCSTTLDILKRDGQIDFPTKKQLRAQIEANSQAQAGDQPQSTVQGQAREQDEASEKETGVVETSHPISQNKGTQHVHSASWQAGYQQGRAEGRAEGMTEALKMLLSNATLNIHHESAQRTLNTLSEQIAGAENTVAQGPMESTSTVSPFVTSMGSHCNVPTPPVNMPKSAPKRHLSDPGECGTSKKARGDEI